MIDKVALENLTRQILIALGEDPEREGLKETPRRVASMLEEFFTRDSEKSLVKIFEEDYESHEAIEIKGINFCSLCEHHLLPFRGTVDVKYVPSGKAIIGLSKLARIVNYFSKGLQVQERLTNQIADFVFKKLGVKGVEVSIEAEHFCMSLRGAKAHGCITKTVAKRGILKT